MGFPEVRNRENQAPRPLCGRREELFVGSMLRTVAQCEAAVADCQNRLSTLHVALAEVLARPKSPKRDQLTQIATNAVRVLERQLKTLRRDLIAARKREGTTRTTRG